MVKSKDEMGVAYRTSKGGGGSEGGLARGRGGGGKGQGAHTRTHAGSNEMQQEPAPAAVQWRATMIAARGRVGLYGDACSRRICGACRALRCLCEMQLPESCLRACLCGGPVCLLRAGEDTRTRTPTFFWCAWRAWRCMAVHAMGGKCGVLANASDDVHV